jgi:hypothetical protein
MSTVVRNINGVKGFCIYKNNVPYTYIYTRDAIEMLGLIQITKKKSKKLMIQRFGEKYKFVVANDPRLKVMDPTMYGIDITPNYSISLDTSINNSSSGYTNVAREISNMNLNRTISDYDDILPEFILDRVIFAIANKLHNETAEEFRSALIWEVIPHFQQTATQDQIAQVPILNQTTQFMYDNTNYTLITQQAYNFAKHILDAHINRISVLLEKDLDYTVKLLIVEFNDFLIETHYRDLKDIVREKLNAQNQYLGIDQKRYVTLEEIIDCIICNTRIYTLFIDFCIYKIREIEEAIVRHINGEDVVLYSTDWNTGTKKYKTINTSTQGKQVVQFMNMDDKCWYNENGIVPQNDLKNMLS